MSAFGLRKRLGRSIAAAFILAAPVYAAGLSHSDEIQAFATIMAMAKVASDQCPEVRINTTILEKAPDFFHMTPTDQQAYQVAAQAEVKRFAAAISAAPSPRAWCDAAYRSYGPDGDVVKDLLGR